MSAEGVGVELVRPARVRTSYELTRAFHEACGLVVRDLPLVPDVAERKLRERLLLEEVAELVCAVWGFEDAGELAEALRAAVDGHVRERFPRAVDPADVAKELADVHVVASGVALHFGIPEDAVLAEVHASNMRKAGGPRRPDGKVLKPPGWQPPDVAGVLARAAAPPTPSERCVCGHDARVHDAGGGDCWARRCPCQAFRRP